MTATLLVLSFLAGPLGREFMPDLPNDVAHDWYGLATWAMICIAFMFVAAGYFRLKRGVDETNKQMKNGHKSVFRRDFDWLMWTVWHMRLGLEHESRQRYEADQRIEGELSAMKQQITPTNTRRE
ncbi:hypothetical protein ORI20_14165 [Mycobacterium sp. CVI_P3]|uniref:Uncharacterized protein n=1 Tax=Mycobacterium pinniadriaticum TaxID=2994102 RepID=A0ABT3SEC5_9MYCO|nr:hypothetical protein [Mycobacterium pinniadriaticum]MCX2931426.1 hypothetical protein [Mycobacterium pinniadriaticum]MCX2937850.1 hypothetical protein [Mycobacterium pinniadriaticum]